MTKQSDLFTGYYAFQSWQYLAVPPCNYWYRFIDAHTKGICHVANARNKVISIRCTEQSGEDVLLGGPRYFILNKTYHEDKGLNMTIYPTMEDKKTLILTWHFNEYKWIATYKFKEHELTVEFKEGKSDQAKSAFTINCEIHFARMYKRHLVGTR